MKNVLIIGNGFDLDIGLKTSYSDFAKSDFWPQAAPIQITPTPPNTGIYKIGRRPHPVLLEHVLVWKKISTWFDLEYELLQYASAENRSNGKEEDHFIDKNIQYYQKLQEGLCDFISDAQNKEIQKDRIAGKVLRAIIDNGSFSQIYSFNYTDLHKIAKSLNLRNDFEYTHIHGNVSDKTIILGVDESNLRTGYKEFHKTSSPYYEHFDIYNALKSAHEIVFFGLSFGKIDYSYFGDFFKGLLEETTKSDGEKQNITIFTKDNNTQSEIKERLREQGLNVQNIFGRSHLCFIGTSEKNNEKKLNEFYERLKK